MWVIHQASSWRRDRALPTLHLLRHAKSDWDDPSLPDHERPLAKRGRKAAKRIAQHLQETAFGPELVLCSTAVRTRETLERIEPALPAGARVELEAELYGARAGELLEAARRVPEDIGEALLIGHNPAIQELALGLLPPGSSPDRERIEQKLPTAALVTLEVEGEWASLAPGAAVLSGFVTPTDLD